MMSPVLLFLVGLRNAVRDALGTRPADGAAEDRSQPSTADQMTALRHELQRRLGDKIN